MEDSERKWQARHKDDVLWGMGISDIAAMIMTEGRAGEERTRVRKWPANITICRHNTAGMKISPGAAATAANRDHIPDPTSIDNNNNETYTDQTVGDCPTKEPDENPNNDNTARNYQPRLSPDILLQYGR